MNNSRQSDNEKKLVNSIKKYVFWKVLNKKLINVNYKQGQDETLRKYPKHSKKQT